jgi:hypothetical protein
MSIPISNDELAKRFFDVMIKTSTYHVTILEQAKLIRMHPGPIAAAYEKNGSLEGTKIYRFYGKYYPVLEQILREGVESTSKRVVEQDVAQLRAKQFRGLPGCKSANVLPDSTSPGWENVVRKIEGD